MLSIPSGPHDLSSEWLSGALRQWANDRSLTVSSFAVEPLVESKGFFGQLVRVRLAYEGEAAGAPRSLVAKFSSPNEAMRNRSRHFYEREVRFYQQLAYTSNLPVPECYYAAIGLESSYHILLLQDLTASSSVPLAVGSRVAGCSVEEARLAVQEIVKLHLRWWGRTDGAELAWLAEDGVDLDEEAMQRQHDQWWPLFYEQAKGHLPAALVQPSRELGRYRAAIRRRVFGSAPRTLIHRDFHADNLFFGDSSFGGGSLSNSSNNSSNNNEGTEGAFAVVDWQFFSRGRAVWDVAYFLSESLVTEDRRRVEMELLKAYHQALCDHGITEYSFEQCLDDYRYCLLQRHSALVFTLATMPFSEEQRHIHLNILLPRHVAALLDHDAFGVLV